jgi:hypothetical protein
MRYPDIWLTCAFYYWTLPDPNDELEYAAWFAQRGIPLYMHLMIDGDVEIVSLMGMIFDHAVAAEWRMRWT